MAEWNIDPHGWRCRNLSPGQFLAYSMARADEDERREKAANDSFGPRGALSQWVAAQRIKSAS